MFSNSVILWTLVGMVFLSPLLDAGDNLSGMDMGRALRIRVCSNTGGALGGVVVWGVR